jgi:hypothetical protein
MREDLELRVEITGEDIARGVPRNPSWCAAALAFRRAIKEAGSPVGFLSVSDRAVSVVRRDSLAVELFDQQGNRRIYNLGPLGRVTLPVPEEVGRLVVAFDGRQHVEPLSFVMTIPGEALT